MISASSSQVNIKLGEDVSDLPWRRPPSIVPKDVKGREMYESSLNISPLKASRSRRSSIQLSKNRSRLHYQGHKEVVEVSEPRREKWDDNFVFDTTTSPSKRPSSHDIKSGGHSKAILGSRRYATPPPPPRKLNKYPLTLGVENAGALKLTDATISLGNEVQKVPLLASPGMVERLSPKKSSNATPLFPGAEQYWDGHVEAVENEENNKTSHFRDQVFAQREENFREHQRDAPSPPPLPSEKSAYQYVEREDYDSESEGSGNYEGDYDSRNYDPQYGQNDSGDYYDDDDGDEEDYYSDEGSEHDSPPMDGPGKRKADLTSQQRGTFFGLYSKNNTPEASGNHDLKSRPVALPLKNNSPSSAKKSANSGLTSQRRGTFFGLYKKEEVEVSKHGGKAQSDSQLRKSSSGSKLSPDAKVSKADNSRGANSKPNAKRDGELTSQRRGTFFGLYKKEVEPFKQGDNTPREASRRTDTDSKKSPNSRVSSSSSNAHNVKSNSATKKGGEMTSQRRGTFFGLYKKDDANRADENQDQNKIASQSTMSSLFKTVDNALSVHEEESRSDHDSPEELQEVLQDMYEKKIESLRNLKASRD